MTTDFKVTALSFFAEVNGKLCLIPIDKEHGETCVAFMSVFQPGQQATTKLIEMPDEVTAHVRKAGEAIDAIIHPKKK